MWKIYFYFVKIPKALDLLALLLQCCGWISKEKKKLELDLDLVEIVHGKKEMYLFSKEKNNVVFFPRQIENDI